MDIEQVVKLAGLAATAITTVGGAIWGYARLNLKVDNTKRELEKHDSKTAEALMKINDRFDVERDRMEKREDMLRDGINAVDNKLSSLHIEVLKALTKGKQ